MGLVAFGSDLFPGTSLVARLKHHLENVFREKDASGDR